jgi:TRAP-type C4-dicarboxylate transport system permease small subunit
VKKIDRFCGYVSKAFGIAAGLFLVVIVVSCFIQVFTRYIMAHALAWSEEAARYSFAWCIMLASVSCCHARAHAGVTILNDLLPKKAKPAHQIFIDAGFALFSLLMLIYGIKLALNQATVISPLLHVPMWAVYAAIPTGGAGMLIMSLNNVLRDIQAVIKPAEKLAGIGH